MYRHLTGQLSGIVWRSSTALRAISSGGRHPLQSSTAPLRVPKRSTTLAQFSLMWHKPDGSLIALNQKDQYLPAVAGQPRQLNPHWYTGPTQCPHRAFGCPCYGPYPHEIKMPSFMTPKREGKASKRAGIKEDEKGKKGKKQDSAQRKLEDFFPTSNSLQLTK